MMRLGLSLSLAAATAILAGPSYAITPLSCENAFQRRASLAEEETRILGIIERERRPETASERERLASVRRIRAFLLVCGQEG